MKIVKNLERKENFLEVDKIKDICISVRREGDTAVKRFTEKYDGINLRNLKIEEPEIKEAYKVVDKDAIIAIKAAIENIEKFSRKQISQFKDFEIETSEDVLVGQKVIPIERVGVYVPAGNFPLVSTVLMASVPAKIAGVKEIILCSPPKYNNSINPAILVASDLCGVKDIFKIGGTQAIAAMAYGTESIPKVDKIVGPGNKYVTAAKRFVFGDVGIDALAGPSEILIIADETADATFVAADLLAQSEHDENAVPILVATSKKLAKQVLREVKSQLNKLKTKNIAEKSLKRNGKIIISKNLDEAIEIANKFAPEHIELMVENPEKYAEGLKNYGTLFMGNCSPNALGDYCTGSNHILPTGGAARFSSGLSVKDFIKLQTYQYVKKRGYKKIAGIAVKFAEIEGLEAHKNSIEIRLEK